MKQLFSQCYLLIAACLISLQVNAAPLANLDHTIYITIINHSDSSLTFDHAGSPYPSNKFSIDKKTIAPGEQGILTAETLSFGDINGTVYFIDQHQHKTLFQFLVQQQRHTGQPIFNLSNSHIKSELLSMTPNPNIGPRNLMYIAATVEVKNK